MGAKYIMQEMVDLHNEGQTLTYPRLQAGKPCGTDELARFAAKHTTFSPAEVKGIIGILADGMAWMMAQGRTVRLDGIGTFSPSLGLREGKEREQSGDGGTRRNASSLCVRGINYRADRQLVIGTDRECQLERQPDATMGRRHHSPYTPDERLALARQFLEGHATMSVGQYAHLTGLSRTQAGRELRRWHADVGTTGIDITGLGSHRLYVLRRAEAGGGNP